MKLKGKSILVTGALLAGLASACSAAPGDANPGATVGTSSDPLTVTGVHLNPDGTTTVTKSTLTVAQAQALYQAKFHRALPTSAIKQTNGETVGTVAAADTTQDTSCAASDLWLEDQANCPWPSSGNLICFSGFGNGNYTLLAPYGWVNRVVSYWPGSEDGFLVWINGDIDGDDSFSANQDCTNGSPASQYTGSHYNEFYLSD